MTITILKVLDTQCGMSSCSKENFISCYVKKNPVSMLCLLKLDFVVRKVA